MNQRKDTYRAALRRDPDTPAPRPVRVTELHTRYLHVTIELDAALPRDVTRWLGPPVSALVRVGATVVRPLRSTP
ncbi:hypothetical protein [Streptomyces brasiliensis]|uniref:Uncharacterized protein n=1 Tax=Streptomyces brasiliensis TaxID=1954 RepID=A0A917L2J8_9ACTN|nr:hypothetical protein [Streptomyces brasiliensis]GGJ41624.1 hypothetical protein GCM10010121_060790 [Streptomyces brasiliensis]